MTINVANAAAVVAANYHFTRFEVQRSIRVINSENDCLLPIDATQDEAVLALIAGQDGIYDRNSKLHLIITEVDNQQHSMIVHEDDDKYLLADSGTDDACTVPSGAYGGVRWAVHAFTSDQPEIPLELIQGDDEQGVRQICAAMQSLVDARDKVRIYNDKLNTAGRTPDGNDYNAVLDMFDL